MGNGGGAVRVITKLRSEVHGTPFANPGTVSAAQHWRFACACTSMGIPIYRTVTKFSARLGSGLVEPALASDAVSLAVGTAPARRGEPCPRGAWAKCGRQKRRQPLSQACLGRTSPFLARKIVLPAGGSARPSKTDAEASRPAVRRQAFATARQSAGRCQGRPSANLPPLPRRRSRARQGRRRDAQVCRKRRPLSPT